MISKIRNYLEYRRNKKIVKKGIIKIGANIVPLIGNASSISKDIIMFITKLSQELGNVEGEEFIEMVLNKVSEVLQSDNARIVEILTYITQLSPRELQSIVTDAMVNTIDNK